MSLKINKMYAFIAEEDNGDEAVVSIRTAAGFMPLVGADMNRVNSIIPLAQRIADQTDRSIKIIMFSNRKEIDEIK